MSHKNPEKMDGNLDNPQAETSAANSDKPARPPKPKTSIGRETKVGLGVIGALLVIFVIVLVIRLRGEPEEEVAKNGASASGDDARQKSGSAKESKSAPKSRIDLAAQTGGQFADRDFNRDAGTNLKEGSAGSRYVPPSNNQRPLLGSGNNQYAAPNGVGPAATAGVDGGTNPADDTPSSPFDGALFPRGNDPSHESQQELQYDPNATQSTDPTPAGKLPPYDRSASAESFESGGLQMRQAGGTLSGGITNLQQNPQPRGPFSVDNTATGIESKNSDPSQSIDAAAGGTQSSVRIVAGEGGNPADDRDRESASTVLEQVKTHQPDVALKQDAASNIVGRGEAGSAGNLRFSTVKPKEISPAAPMDDLDANESGPPAPLKADSAHGDELYVVAAKDTYWDIAQKAYGSGAYFKALHEYNRRHTGQGPVVLRAGAQLRLPDEATLQQLFPTLCPPPQRLAAAQARRASADVEVGQREYEVQEGDTLYEIARRERGNGKRFAEIYELNQDRIGKLTDRLQPGTRLRLPGER